FVTREFNATERREQKALCGRFTTCDTYSLTTVIEQERKRKDLSFIADPASSWIDDYFLWLNPDQSQCCRKNKKTGNFCQPWNPPTLCKACFKDRDPAWDITLKGMPEGREFLDYLQVWL